MLQRDAMLGALLALLARARLWRSTFHLFDGCSVPSLAALAQENEEGSYHEMMMHRFRVPWLVAKRPRDEAEHDDGAVAAAKPTGGGSDEGEERGSGTASAAPTLARASLPT